MKTSRTISNVSYNSDEHFSQVIASLKRRGIIEWCYWIRHKAEDDELKDHIHFVLRPSGRIETNDLANEFLEKDSNNIKPLGVTSKWQFTPDSNISDWLLYVVHDIPYLASKGQFRKYHYELDEILSTDYDALLNDWNSINRSAYKRLQALQEAIENRVPFVLLVQQGVIPLSQRAQYQAQYNELAKLMYDRKTNRKQSHEDEIPSEFKKVVDEEYEQMTFD